MTGVTPEVRPCLSVQVPRELLRGMLIYLLPWFVFVPFVKIPGTPLSTDDLLPLGIIGVGILMRPLAKRPRGEAVTIALLSLAVVNLASALANVGPEAEVTRMVARGFGRFLLYAALLDAIRVTLSGPRDVRRMLGSIVVVAMAQSCFCLWAYWTNYSGPAGIGMAVTPDWTTLRRVHGTFGGGISNEGGTSVGSNFLAAFLMCALILAAGLLLYAKQRPVKIIWAAAACLCAAAMGVSFTRASFVAAALGLVVLGLLQRRFALVAVVGICGAGAALSVPGFAARLATVDSNRLGLYAAGAAIAWDHPGLGVGDGNYLTALRGPRRYERTDHGVAISTPHNSMLLCAAHAGFVAAFLLLFCVLFAIGRMLLWSLWARDPEQKLVMATLAAASVAFWLQDQSNNLLFVPKTATFFWVFVGLSLVAVRGESR